MMNINDELFFKLIHDYLMIYLPKQRRASQNTIRSYRMILNQFIDFIAEYRNIPMRAITFDNIDNSIVSEYIEWLSSEKGCSDTTCNHHLTGLKAFLSYASAVEPLTVKYFNDIRKVPSRKVPKNISVEYMTENAVKAILQQPDTHTEKGVRDLFMMVLMYDTGARISEILGMKIKDIHIRENPYATLFGKGGKTRTVPLMPSTVQHFKRYMQIFHANETDYSQEYLFYVKSHGAHTKISDAAVRKFMKKYADAARLNCTEIPEKIYPHLWRHTRAMHLYQHGMDLTLISQWLGHADLETTLIYAHADTEMKRKAIEKAEESATTVKAAMNTSRFTVTDEAVLKKLYGLK